jgi:hypothetical protein
MVIWYMFTHFGMLCEEKSGNPARVMGKNVGEKKKTMSLSPPGRVVCM